MHMDPALPALVVVLLVIFLLGLTLRLLNQPHVVGYLLAGVCLGPELLGLITDKVLLERLGAFGVVLLLFFVGMEVSPQRLISNWRVALLGTLLQIVISVGVIWLLGEWFGWSMGKTVLFGFVISLSSTAVVLKLLQDWGEMETPVGQNSLGILLTQDLAIIPMLIVVSLIGGKEIEAGEFTMQLVGGVAMISLFSWIVYHGKIQLPLARWIKGDHELQVFAAMITCLGLGMLTGMFSLSTALGAFIGGMIIGAARETQWVHHSLEPFRVIFVALFFVSVGMLVDISLILQNWLQISLLVLAVFVTNMAINALILKGLGSCWGDSIYAGALLAQIGEFAFVLAAVGMHAGVIVEASYQLIIAVISLTLLLSPAWVTLTRYMLNKNGIYLSQK
ncbi:transporter, CPA2 family [Mariprofundus aestuarium]|uniref:Transporter, CPA2 family n=1 Tax=Mariprofundus aestuarium TaxID=1921086 RepID=A0A2K8L1Q5_MARES|nr:cation:proton antiporter [Mariprofundus aestuarium]ATX79761.1 transporter, CPA2 family [Mariprofundus aestuarium]